jgi:hypothetical protein
MKIAKVDASGCSGLSSFGNDAKEGSDGNALQERETAVSNMWEVVYAESAITSTSEDLRASGMPEGVAPEEVRGMERKT